MYFLLWLLIAVYFGCLAACNVCFAARMPGAISRWLAIGVIGTFLSLLLTLLGFFMWLWEFDDHGWFSPCQTCCGNPKIMEGNFYPYATLAITIVGSHFGLAYWGLQKMGGRPRAAEWSMRRLLAVSLVFLIAAGMNYQAMDRKAKAELSRAHADSIEHLVRIHGPPIPDLENGWLTYKSIDRAVIEADLPPAYRTWRQNKAEWDWAFPSNDPTVSTYAILIAPAIPQIRAAADFPSCQAPLVIFPVGAFEPINTQTTSQLRPLGWILAFDAYYQAAQNQSHETVQDVLAMRRISEHLAQDLDRYSLYASLGCEDASTDIIKFHLQRYLFSESDLTSLAQAVTPHRSVYLPRYLQANEQQYRGTYASLYLTSKINFQYGSDSFRMSFGRVFLAQYDFHILAMTEKLRSVPAEQNPKQLLAAADHQARWFPYLNTGYLSVTFLDDSSGLLRSIVRTETRSQLARTGIAAYLFALKEARFPESIRELQGFQPDLNLTDPCSGEPLKLVNEGDKFTIYSVGLNQQDDFGSIGTDRDQEHTDIVFTLNLPPAF